MSILVVGGAGYIGSHTVKLLDAAGMEPVVFDNLSSGHEWALKWGKFERGDLADPVAIRTVLKRHDVRAVIHFAALIQVGESVTDPSKYFRANFVNTLNLLDEMVAAGVREIVFSSSAAVYGDPVRVPLDEEHPLAPLSPYGDSKLMIEKVLARYERAYGVRSAALRYFNAAGADPAGELGEAHPTESHLIPLAIQAALGRGRPLSVFGTDYPTPDGTAVRDYVHINDLAAAHVAALRHLAGGGASFVANVGIGRGYSVKEVMATVEKVAGLPVPHQLAPRRPGDSPVLVADPSRIRGLLGWKPQYAELEEIVAHAWKWEQRRPRGGE
ncbi:MAG TPA: UDP-glucose 4-epimerase GalE [Polyangia bacterium]|nr:UDP-glucose 4-epimerase GalE [Polyangia bacterium]